MVKAKPGRFQADIDSLACYEPRKAALRMLRKGRLNDYAIWFDSGAHEAANGRDPFTSKRVTQP